MKEKLNFKDKFMCYVYYLSKGKNPPKEEIRKFSRTEGFISYKLS